jgi:hypothetical protein
MRGALLVALIIASGNTGAKADLSDTMNALSANFILQACEERPTESDGLIGNCLGQIQMLYELAYIDGLSLDRKFCPPTGATINQTRDVIVKYIEDRPEQKHLPFLFLALDAVKKAWPCHN